MKKKSRLVLVVLFALLSLTVFVLYPPKPRQISFPDGKRFAFTIVDDTDLTTLERVEPIYEFLYESGFRTTKTVWALESIEKDHSPNRGDSLQDPEYREFVVSLQERGFEIGLHGVRGGSSTREGILTGLDQYRRILGEYPNLHVNHSLNRDNVYWGADRLEFIPFVWLQSLVGDTDFSGHDPESPYFWGDVLSSEVKYVRRFTFPEVNLLKVNPSFPYHLSEKKFVNYWFPTANGNNADKFIELISEENLNRLEEEGGVCIVYTHFGAGSFFREGRINPEFKARIDDLSQRNGWFVPASELLDYLQSQPGWDPELSFRERVRLETIFLIKRVLHSPR